jgi:putative oxidoreductase
MQTLEMILLGITAWCKRIPDWLIQLMARAAIFTVFWRSAQTKIDGWEIFGQNLQFFNVTSTTVFLFENEYDLPLLPPELAAYMATFGEFFLSLFILLGFATRLSALGLLIMTLVIQVLVYPEAWPTHVLWAGLLLYLLKFGAGKMSIDQMLIKASD